MRTSTSRARSRLLCAGITTGAVTAALLAVPQAAFAADVAFTSSPGGGPGAGTVVTLGGPALLTNITTPVVFFTTAATCPTTVPVTPPGVWLAGTSVTKVADDKLTVAAPTLLLSSGAAQTYNVCVYAAAANGSAIAGHGTYTITPTATLAPTLGASGGGGTVTATISGTTLPSTLGATFAPGSPGCPTSYTNTANIATASVVRTSGTVATVAVPTAVGGPTAANPWSVCVYNGTTATSALVATSTYNTYPTVATTPISGPSGGGNAITVTTPTTNPYPDAIGAAFTAAANPCPAIYPAPGGNAFPATTMRTSNTAATVTVPINVAGGGGPAPAPWAVCLYNGTTSGGGGSALIGVGSAPYNVALPQSTLSSVIGAAGGTYVSPGVYTALPTVNLTVSSPTNFLTGYSAPAGLVQTAPCPALYPTTPALLAAAVRKVLNSKATVTLPTSAAVMGTPLAPTPYNVCVYSSNSDTSGRLLTSTVYTATVMPTVTRVLPGAGPALGNSPITVIGTNFPVAPGSIRATLGGTPLLNITPISDTSFTAVTQMHPTGDDQALVVTTDAGSVNLAAAYDYTYGIVANPNTGPSSMGAIDVDVTGVGFLTLPFATLSPANQSPNDADAHVFLVNGAYNPSSTGSSNVVPIVDGTKVNGPIAECTDVLVISDNELICRLHLGHRMSPAGVFPTMTTVARAITDAVTTAGTPIITSAGASFTSTDVGQALRGNLGNTVIPAGTTIVSVISATKAVLSAHALLTATGLAVDVGGAARTAVAVTAGTALSTNIAGSNVFSAADIGRVITGTGIAPGTTITDIVGPAGATTGAVLSKPFTATGGTSVDLFAPLPVPNGSYNLTIVNHAELNAPGIYGEDYLQSSVSSGSTFTVSPF